MFGGPDLPIGPLDVSARLDGNRTLITLRGELDFVTRDLFDARLADVEEIAPGPIHVDLSGLTFVDSAGVHALVHLVRRSERDGRALVLADPSPAVERILRLTDLKVRFPLDGRGVSEGS